MAISHVILAVIVIFFLQNLKTKIKQISTPGPLGLNLMQLYFSYSNDFDMNLKKRYVATN